MQHRIRVKFCGMTRLQDALAAIDLGVDALGFVFYEPSPRNVAVDAAAAIVEALPPFVSTVGLFVDAETDRVRDVAAAVPLDFLQFHGDEAPEACERAGRPWIKAIRMGDGIDVRAAAARYRGASALLLDTFEPGRHGGTGTTFDWGRVPSALSLPIVLAGRADTGQCDRGRPGREAVRRRREQRHRE